MLLLEIKGAHLSLDFAGRRRVFCSLRFLRGEDSTLAQVECEAEAEREAEAEKTAAIKATIKRRALAGPFGEVLIVVVLLWDRSVACLRDPFRKQSDSLRKNESDRKGRECEIFGPSLSANTLIWEPSRTRRKYFEASELCSHFSSL